MATKNKPLATKASTEPVKTNIDVSAPKSAALKPTSKKPTKVNPEVKAKTATLASKPKTNVAPSKKAAPGKADSPKESVIAKPKKFKLIRDSFTIPENEYKLIQALKERSSTHGVSFKKSELLRAGILKLISLKDAEFVKAISAVDIIKTGRPAKAK